jgi:copper homeostasis protein
MSVRGQRVLLEACVASVADAAAAVQNGADRLELNVGLELGGLTPSYGLLGQVKDAVDVPVVVMIRPRAGGFCYSPSEKRLMIRDAHGLLAQGADGIVTGATTAKGDIDIRFLEDMRNVCRQRELVFHMAFDSLPNRAEALEQLIGLRVSRVLTAGGQATALAGHQVVADSLERAGGKIEILPGGGVRSGNVSELLLKTGCDQVHGTFKRILSDPAGNVCSDTYPALDKDEVKAVREVLDRQDSGNGL